MNAVVIVAGGKGLRMGTDIPKQFLEIGGKPVLMHTIEAFRRFDGDMQIVLVLPESQQGFWRKLCEEHHFDVEYDIANGGQTRFHSVKNGLALVSQESSLIGVHDGVRPFVSADTIRLCYQAAEIHGAALPVTDIVETVRKIDGNSGSHTVDRNAYKAVQTPQVFDAVLLRKAYQQEYRDGFTDDASVVEALGHDIFLVKGNRENIKITTPFDIIVANALLNASS